LEEHLGFNSASFLGFKKIFFKKFFFRGGDVCWEDCYPVGSITNVSSELITHQIVDREMKEMIINRFAFLRKNFF